jgi:hypothetical protein
LHDGVDKALEVSFVDGDRVIAKDHLGADSVVEESHSVVDILDATGEQLVHDLLDKGDHSSEFGAVDAVALVHKEHNVECFTVAEGDDRAGRSPGGRGGSRDSGGSSSRGSSGACSKYVKKESKESKEIQVKSG